MPDWDALHWDALRSELVGDVVVPDSPDYEAVRRPAMSRFHDVRPAAIVRCATPTDVVRTLSFVRRAGLPLAIRSGGHCFAGRSSTEGVVLDVSPMDSVGLDGDLATIGAGARLGDVYAALSASQRTIPAGCGATVGIAGLTLGGGIGILGRRYGLTADRLLGAQVVLADERVVDCDDAHDADLFWALRGAGGGRFGVVTSLRFATVPARGATAFALTWPPAAATSVISAWQQRAPLAPDELAASLLVSVVGGQPLRVGVFGAMQGSEADARQQLDEVAARVHHSPASATFIYDGRTKQHLAEIGDRIRGADTGQLVSRSEFFERALPADAITDLVDGLTHELPSGQSRELDFSPMGGAYNRVAPSTTAFVHRQDSFLLKQEVGVASGDPTREALGWLAQSWSTAHRYGTGRAYQNFPEPDLDSWAPAYFGPNRDRLLDIKRRYDPEARFDA